MQTICRLWTQKLRLGTGPEAEGEGYFISSIWRARLMAVVTRRW